MILKHFNSLLFLIISFFSLAQNQYKEKLDIFVGEQKQEKIYLHFDKPQYGAGENIWFKAYVTNASTHLPTDVSTTLYVELINEKKLIVDSLTLLIRDGASHGSFSTKVDLAPGSYRVRAYTEWMRNSDNDFFFRKDFIIVNASSNEDIENPETFVLDKERPLISFLPEGGDIIDGIPVKVAIKATNKNGERRLVSGTIVNQNGKPITKFESNKFGYSLFFLKNPDFKESYHAIVAKDTFKLPEVKKAGASIRILHSYKSDEVLITVLSKKIDLTDGTLVVHRRGQFLLSQKCLNKTSLAVKLKKSQLKAGIIHLTFFDKNQIPLTERLLFPNPPLKKPSVTILANEQLYKKRSKVVLDFNSGRDTVHSASVTINSKDESSYNKYGNNIVNYLLLSSDLKGKIESPDFYFSGSEEAYKSLDLLMLTHGWSRFNWTSLLNENKLSPEFLPEKGLKINGEVTKSNNDKNFKEALIGLTIPSIGVINETFNTNEDGTFEIIELTLMDSTIVFLKAFKNEKNNEYRNVNIQLTYPSRPDVASIPNPESQINPVFIKKTKKLKQISNAYFTDTNVTTLEEVVVTGERIKQNDMNKRASIFYTQPSNRLIIDSLGSGATNSSVFDLIRGRIAGVKMNGNFPDQTIFIRGKSPSYFIDGRPADKETIQLIPIQEVEFIDVLKGSAALMVGSKYTGGAVLVYTRRGVPNYQEELFEKPKGLLVFTHPGYHKAKKHFSPQYDQDKEEHIIPDYRTTLHWDPELKFENNQANTSFFTSDQSGTFVIKVEGIYTDGRPFYEEEVIVVE